MTKNIHTNKSIIGLYIFYYQQKLKAR